MGRVKKYDDHWFNMWRVYTKESFIDIGNQFTAKDAILYAQSHCRNSKFTKAKLIYDPTGLFKRINKRRISR